MLQLLSNEVQNNYMDACNSIGLFGAVKAGSWTLQPVPAVQESCTSEIQGVGYSPNGRTGHLASLGRAGASTSRRSQAAEPD